jgi:hypothetical protein
MKKYMVYFSIFGKKLKTEILAKDKEQAKRFVLDKVTFHKFEEIPLSKSDSELFNHLKDIFNM